MKDGVVSGALSSIQVFDVNVGCSDNRAFLPIAMVLFTQCFH